MYGIADLIRSNNLNVNKKLLFTYFGEGNFLVMIFDEFNVEMMLNPDSDDSGM